MDNVGVKVIARKSLSFNGTGSKSVMVGDMSLRSAEVFLISTPLTSPFRISLGTMEEYRAVVVVLKNDEGITGYGEGQTIRHITGESPEVIFDGVIDIFREVLSRDSDSLEEFSESVRSYGPGLSTAKSAVEGSIYDLYSRSHNLPLSHLLGGSLSPRTTSFTIPIGSIEENLSLLRVYKEQGARVIKVKVGKDLKYDMDRTSRLVREMSGEDFYVDANQGYSLNQAIKLSSLLYKLEALFFEQPLRRDDIDGLRELRERTSFPVMCDESVFNPSDVIKVYEGRACDMINVKISKSGGVKQALTTLQLAKVLGMEAMVGCMLESRHGISQSLAVANSSANVFHVDLDGFTYLKGQVFKGGVEIKKGEVFQVEGLGSATEPGEWLPEPHEP